MSRPAPGTVGDDAAMGWVGVALDRFFRITTALGAVCFVAVAVLVAYQLGGEVFPYVPRSADEFAGYCMGASAFLGLADALRARGVTGLHLGVDARNTGAIAFYERVGFRRERTHDWGATLVLDL